MIGASLTYNNIPGLLLSLVGVFFNDVWTSNVKIYFICLTFGRKWLEMKIARP